jgi:hypothetical protein
MAKQVNPALWSPGFGEVRPLVRPDAATLMTRRLLAVPAARIH